MHIIKSKCFRFFKIGTFDEIQSSLTSCWLFRSKYYSNLPWICTALNTSNTAIEIYDIQGGMTNDKASMINPAYLLTFISFL